VGLAYPMVDFFFFKKKKLLELYNNYTKVVYVSYLKNIYDGHIVKSNVI
jgi:hypothetical protein